jgi:hypothetical protein
MSHDLDHMSIHSIARLIRQDWKNPYFGAVPYLNAMQSLDSVDDSVGYDSGASIVRYFLSNARTYGKRTSAGLVDPAAVKKVLKKRIEGKY